MSSSRMRASFGVSQYMQSAGYRVIPVNPNEREVLGEKSYGRLEDVPEKTDIVNIFRRSEFVSEVVDSAIAVGAKATQRVARPDARVAAPDFDLQELAGVFGFDERGTGVRPTIDFAFVLCRAGHFCTDREVGCGAVGERTPASTDADRE